MRPRKRVVSVRLTDTEYERLRRRAEVAGRKVSDQIRAEMFHRPAPVVPVPGYGSGSITLPNPANVVWLTDGHTDGGTLTLAA